MAKRSGVWITRTIRAGNVGEKIKYFLPDGAGRGKSGGTPTRDQRRRLERAEKKAEGSAVRTLARLINANWPGGAGVLLGLDYTPGRLERVLERAGAGDLDAIRDRIRAAAEQELRLALRRARRKTDRDLRYVAITSDMDGDSGELVRVHHHIVCDPETAEAIRAAWDADSVHAEPLNARQEDHTPVAAYLLRQVRKIPDAKKYTPSRNLERPVPRDRIAQGPAQLRVPSGDRLIESRADHGGRVQYLRYIIGGAKKPGRPREDPDETDGEPFGNPP